MKQENRACLIGLAAFAGLFVVLRSRGLMINDDGWYLHPVLRMRAGEILYRDVFTYYAPLPHHALSTLFALTGPSILVARTLWMAVLLGSIAGSYRIARRLGPPSIAWIPAVAYGLAPGPWPKAPYAFCTVMFFLALVRALERRTTVRVVVLGMAAGFTLMTRQEIGLVQTALATTLMALAPSLASGTHVRGTVMSGAWAAVLVILGLVTAVAPVVVYYQVQGALPDLVAAVFGQAVSYSNRPPLEFLRLIDPRTLGSALEGRGVGFLLLVPLVLFVVVIAQLVRALRLRPLTPQTLVAAALVVHAVPAFVQGYNPPLLIRYLQSAMVVYLLAVWVIGSLDGRTRQTAMGVAILVLVLQTVGVVVGFERVNPSGVYTGSLRLLSYRTPVRILGDTVFTDDVMAREIAFARDFFDQNTRPAEPIFAAPLHSLWYVLLERTNPTAFLGDFGHVAMSVQRKEQEMARLVASDTRYALVDRAWWHFGPRPDRPMLNTLATVFRPVATFGSLVILERRVPTPHVS